MKIKFLLVILSVLGLAGLSGCSFQRDAIVGYWDVRDRFWSFRPLSQNGPTDSTAFGPLVLHFKADHTLVVTSRDEIETFEWRWVESNALELKSANYNCTIQVELKGDNLVVHDFDFCRTITCVRVDELPTEFHCTTEFP